MSAPVSTPAPRRGIPAAARGSDYAALGRAVRSAGVLDRRPGAYAAQVAAILLLYAATCTAIAMIGDSWYQLIAAVVLGIAFTQVAFLGHDGGHQQVFALRRANDLFGQVMGNLLVGLSYGWWVSKHNRRHANPNKEGHDPDIGDGVLAFTTGQVAARTGWLGRAITRRQAWLFFPLLTLERLNLNIASVLSCCRERSAAPAAVSAAPNCCSQATWPSTPGHCCWSCPPSGHWCSPRSTRASSGCTWDALSPPTTKACRLSPPMSISTISGGRS
jgi:hypothetical protein